MGSLADPGYIPPEADSRAEEEATHALLLALLDLIPSGSHPRWWVIENVRGAQRWVGTAADIAIGPFRLWTNIPAEAFAGVPRSRAHWGAYKMRLAGNDRAKAGRERGAIPLAVAQAVTLWAESHP